MNRFLTGLAGFGAVLAAGALYLQHATISELRDEISALRTDVQQVAKQQRETAEAPRHETTGPAAAVAVRENTVADEQRAEFARLREEIRGLKTSTQEITQIARAAAAKNMDTSAVPMNITPVSAMKNAGKATPAQATETILWAATGGDIDALADAVVLEPKAKKQADHWFAGLSDETRAQYGSPEKVLALMMAKDAAALTGMQVVGQQEIKPDLMAVRVRMQADNGKTKDENLAFYQAPDGWRMVLPQSFLEKQMGILKGKK